MASWNPERPFDALAEKSLRDSGRGHLSRHTSAPPPDSDDRAQFECWHCADGEGLPPDRSCGYCGRAKVLAIEPAEEQMDILDEIEDFDEWMRRMRKVASENEGQA